jgi:hypothetical protein
MSRTRIRVAGAWVDLTRGPKGDQGIQGIQGLTGPSGIGGVFTGFVSGLLVAGAGGTKLWNDTGGDVTIASTRATLVTPPGGGPATFDVNLNGTTIFTNQAHRPSIAAGGTTSGLVVPDVTVWPAGQYLTVDTDLIGTSYAGANLTFQIGLV